MLTSYTYYEPQEQKRIQIEVKENDFFDQEKEIAREFTKNHSGVANNIEKCPICGGNNMGLFFSKWNIPYYRCNNCFSIIAGVKDDWAVEYATSLKLQQFYNSDEYQDYGEKTRGMQWSDTIDWISFRTYRYTGNNKDLRILDFGNRWKGFQNRIKRSNICSDYKCVNIYDGEKIKKGNSDVVLVFDYIQRKTNPISFFQDIYNTLGEDGLLFLGFKAGSGMDILLLREKNKNIFPYEHLLMPSKEGVYEMLSNIGFEILEYTTPGMFDVNFVRENVDDISDEDCFMKYLFNSDNEGMYSELQRFIQKAGMSSYAQLVARKK